VTPSCASRERCFKTAVAIFICLTGVFLLLGSREQPWGDAGIMYEVADRIAVHGTVAIQTEWPPMSHRGVDGHVFSQYALGPSLVSVPGVWLRAVLVRLFPGSAHLILVLTAHLVHAMLGAAVCALFYRMARRCQCSPKLASFGTVVLAVGTMLFVYARSPFSEIFQTFAAVGFTGALVEVLDSPTRRRALTLGVWAGILLNAKSVFAMSIVASVVLVAVRHRGDRASLARALAWTTAALSPFVVLALGYNHARWGSPFDTGYGATLKQMRENVASGLWGLLFSPGKSIFLFSPPLVIGALALPRFAREHRWLALAMAAVIAPPLLFYARFVSWGGDYCWGPRYLLFAVPLLWLPAVASLLPRAESAASRAACAGVIALGIAVQVLGASFYWDHWIRVAIHAREAWLGHADRRGALVPTNEAGLCDGCFEDNHGHDWLPPLSPILGHAWLFRHVGDPWEVAQPDAPWRRYTSVDMPDVAQYYRAAGYDWWGLLWTSDRTPARNAGVLALGVFVVAAVGGGRRWWRSLPGPEDATG